MTCNTSTSTQLKTLDTIGNCQRLVFSLGVSQHMHKIRTQLVVEAYNLFALPPYNKKLKSDHKEKSSLIEVQTKFSAVRKKPQKEFSSEIRDRSVPRSSNQDAS